jgi:hypothetical protein
VKRGALAATLALVLVFAVGCAHAPRRSGGVPIDQRPTPPQPTSETVTGNGTTPAGPSGTAAPSSAPVGAALSAAERQQALARIVADTTAASAAVRRCAASKTLLPDQESVFETTRGYLVQARAALRRDELWQAESLARKARQLALSLECH